jgi:hypothetical protein
MIEQQELMRRCIRPRFPQLLHNSGSVGIPCHVKTQNLSPVVGHDKEAVQHAKGERRYREEVHRGNGLTVILEEGQPAFGEIRSSGHRRIHRETVVSERSKPSLSSST